ncbi:MAG: alpha/beta hydrolase [Lentisphaerae bacterium]|nr:alpha/beta hydrolase [Lentisphaerota bacterium]
MRLPIILIAGWGFSSKAMLGLKEALPGYSIEITSTTELGRTQATDASPRAPGLSRYALALGDLLRRYAGGAGVIGWSMGGIVALETAQKYPELIERLVIIGGTARFCALNNKFPGVSPAALRAMAFGLRRTPEKVLSDYEARVHAPQAVPVPRNHELTQQAREANGPLRGGRVRVGTAPRAVRLRDAAKRRYGATTVRGAFGERALPIVHIETEGLPCEELLHGLNYLQRIDLTEGLDRLNVPTLVVHGNQDGIVPWQAGEWLSRQLARGQWRGYEGFGHALPMQVADILAADIRAFLA